MNKNYIPLHNHSHYSTLDGYATIDEYIEAAKRNNMKGIGLCDHGTASGLYKFITRTQAAGLTPVPGIEFYVAPENPDGAKNKSPIYYGEGGKRAPKYDVSRGAYTHLTVFAYNNKGLENLFKLTSLSWEQEHFYHEPRIDTNMLAEHSEGLIVTTGCPSSEVSRRFLLGQDDKAYEYTGRLKSIFGDNLYVEIMNHKMKDDDLEHILVPKQIKLAKDLGIKLIATNDSHYAFKEDAEPHERILAVSTKVSMNVPRRSDGGTRFAFSTPEYHIKTYEEMLEVYPEEVAEEALANTNEILEKCKGIKISYDSHLRPEIEIPEGYTELTYLQKLIYDGFVEKRGHESKEIQEESVERIREEFEVLHSNDFISYFLVVHDYIDFAHRKGIGVGAGRGSVGGSEIAYVLDISNTDPIRFDLLFERFLSPGRGSLYQIDYVSGESEEIPVSSKKALYTEGSEDIVYIHELYPGDMVNFKDRKEVIKDVYVKVPGSAPDVDTDFHTEGREEVVQYCIDRYGEENVANIVTFGTFRAKKSFKAMSTIYNVPFALANKVSDSITAPLERLVDPSFGEGSEFRQAIDNNPVLEEAVEMAIPLDGRISETGVHPCGVIISNKSLKGIVPTQVRQNDGKLITQWEYPELEALGLIKMDLLGLDLINTVQQTLENIELTNKSAQNESEIREIPDLRKLTQGPMDDKETYEMLQSGHTIGIFQLGGAGVRDLLRRAKPESFMDIATITALYRPGPMSVQAHTEWADRNNGVKEIEYLDKEFDGTVIEDILKDTAGILVFQESLMQIATQYGGMTPYESDMLRKAMGKKDMDIMLSLKPKFVEGAIENGSTKRLAEKVWDTMEGFGSYGFNKCTLGSTLVNTKDGKKRIDELYKIQEENNEDIYIESMFEDGSIKEHKVSKIVKSGRKPVYKVKTKSGKTIHITKEHRMLTTDGYGSIEDGKLAIGKELIADEEWGNKISKRAREARRKNMIELNKKDFMREKSREWMTKYQSTLTFEDRSKHQKEISKHSNRHEVCLPVGRAKLEELRKDPEWMNNFTRACHEARQKQIKSGNYVGFGKPTQLSNGQWCDSMVEALAGEYLLERGIEFELHKIIENDVNGAGGEMCDFYVDGLYFEMDGLNRGREYFVENKYGEDIPFVYMTPENFGDVIDEAIMNYHIENGDEIVEIIPPKVGKNGKQYTNMTYDIEMGTDGPANFIANGLVSHNSHSVSYAINIYQTIYLKTHYPSEFMAALIQQGYGDADRVREYIQEAQRMRLKLGPVDINNSQVVMASTGVDKDKEYDIVFGFSGIKQMNNTLAQTIVDERNENGDYTSVANFISRVSNTHPITASPLSNLALAGAFDTFGVSRKMVVEKASLLVNSGRKKVDKGVSLFSMMGPDSNVESVEESIELHGEDYDFNELIQKEADVIGMFVSGHPTSRLGHISNMYNPTTIQELIESNARGSRKVLGTITQMNFRTNKSGNRSIALMIDDGNSTAISYLPRNIVQSIEKYEELERIKKAEEDGVELKETRNSQRLATIINDKSIKTLKTPELNEPYVFEVSPRGWGGIGIVGMKRLHTAPDGSLPYELNVDNARLKHIIDITKKHEDEDGSYVKVNLPDEPSRLLENRVKLSIEFIMDIEKIVGPDSIVTDRI